MPQLTLLKTGLSKKTGLSTGPSTAAQVKSALMFRPWEPAENLKLGAVLEAGAQGVFLDEAEAILGGPGPGLEVVTDFFGNQLTLKNYNSFRGAWVPT